MTMYNILRNHITLSAAVAMLTASGMVSCTGSDTRNGDNNSFSFDDFTEVTLDSLQGTVLTDDVDFGRGVAIRAVNDSILAVRVIRSENQVVMYNQKTGRNQAAIATGSGPLEMLRVAGMSVSSDGRLWAVGSGDKKVVSVQWCDTADHATPVLHFAAGNGLLNGVTDSRGGIVALPAFDSDARVALLDGEGAVTATLGDYPQVGLPDSVKADNIKFQADIAYSPDRNAVVVSNKSWAEIEIYNLDDSTTLRLRGPVAVDAKIVGQDTPMGTMYAQKPMWIVFDGITAGSESFYVGYIGVKIQSEQDLDRTISRILEFDYDGKPVRCFTFSHDITAFDVDSENNAIYTIENRPEPTIVKYPINH